VFNPTKYNLAIQEYYSDYSANIVIDAVAGSGKTTQIEQLCKADLKAKKLYLVFSKDMQLEVEPRLSVTNTEVKTFHSFGLAAIRRNGYKAKPDNWKYHNIFDSFGYDPDTYGITKNQAVKVLEIIRDWYEPITSDSVLDAMDHWDYEAKQEFYDGGVKEFAEFLNYINLEGMKDLNTVSFNDMIYAPLFHSMSFPRFDSVFVDEMQDLNRSKQLMTSRIRARIIGVGDPYQAIYGFSGADTKSFWNTQELLDAKVFPLSLCFRCPDQALELAREYVPHIEGTGKQGIVNHWDYNEALTGLQPGNLVICRRNAPLVSMALKLMVQKKPCKIKGREFSEFVIRLIEDVEKSKQPYSNLPRAVEQVVAEKIKKIRNEGKIQNLLDASECISAIHEESSASSFIELKSEIRSLFFDKGEGDFITLSSIHRAKGLERDNVTILTEKGLTPPGCGQESNLSYVALTRTKNVLNFVKI